MSEWNVSALGTIREFYRLVDDGELERAFEIFSPDAVVRFGDQPEIHGRAAIADRIRGLRTMARTWSHVFLETYEVAGPGEDRTAIIEGTVTYEMLRSGNMISHRAVMVDVVDSGGQIVVQRNVGDLSPVFQDHERHAADAPGA